MSFRTFAGGLAVLVGVAGLPVVSGCSSATADASGKEPVESYESELRLASPKYLGQIASGETKTVSYSNPPKFRAYGFTARGGDQITADVKSVNGDAMAWITTTTFDVLVANDDATSNTLDSKVVYTVPAGTASRAYRVVFRDYDLSSANFSVTLAIKSGSASCSYGGATYAPGDSFAATDGCNTCSCSAAGNAVCTKKACVAACDPESEPWRNYVGTPSQCMMIRYSCSGGKVSFQNACGCGCESPTH
jgi:hypothetical protein